MLVDSLSLKESVCVPTRFCKQSGVMAGRVTRLAWKFILLSSAGCWAENVHPISLLLYYINFVALSSCKWLYRCLELYQGQCLYKTESQTPPVALETCRVFFFP